MNTTEENIKIALSKTGFLLEHEITEILSENGWYVINGKYYIDDTSSSIREIDIIAYKASVIGNLQSKMLTALIISCKQNIKNNWVFMSRDIKGDNPNFKKDPIHYTTTDHRFSIIVNENDYKKELYEKMDGFFDISKEFFAYQEVSNDKPHNDKNIYNSIVTALKCQEYEREMIKERKKNTNRVYQFNLITVADVDMYDAYYNKDFDSPVVNKIDSLTYMSNHIINKKELSALVKIQNKSNFIESIERYNKLHEFNGEYLSKCLLKFYKNKNFQDVINIVWLDCLDEFYKIMENNLSKNCNIKISKKIPTIINRSIIIYLTDFEESCEELINDSLKREKIIKFFKRFLLINLEKISFQRA